MAPKATLPLLAFQRHVGPLYIDPAQLEFVAELGVGELALVERGRWYAPDGSWQHVVVKGYKPYIISTPEDFRELVLEASKLQRLQHPHIVHFLGLGCFQCSTLAQVRGSIFMVEDYAGLTCLKKLLSEQMRSRAKNLYRMKAALTWMQQVACALAALHAEQPAYIHGDVKPDNVFLTDGPIETAVAKLGDLKPHRYIYDKASSTLSRYLHSASSRSTAPVRPCLSDSAGLQQSSLARHGARSPCDVMALKLQQQQQQQAPLPQCMSADDSPVAGRIAVMARPASCQAAAAGGAGTAAAAVARGSTAGSAAGAAAASAQGPGSDRDKAAAAEQEAAAATAGEEAHSAEAQVGALQASSCDTKGGADAGAVTAGSAMAVNQPQPSAKSSPLPIALALRKSYTFSGDQVRRGRDLAPCTHRMPLDDSAMDSTTLHDAPRDQLHHLQLQLQQVGSSPVQQHEQVVHAAALGGGLVCSRSLPSDDLARLVPPGGDAPKRSASLGKLLRTAGRLLGQEQAPPKRLLYSELAAGSAGTEIPLSSGKAPGEGQVHGQQLFSLGSSQDLLLSAGSTQHTDSDADTRTPYGSGVSNSLLDEGSGHFTGPAAAGSVKESPGVGWLQQVLYAGRSGSGNLSAGHVLGKQQVPLSSSLSEARSMLSTTSDEVAAAAGQKATASPEVGVSGWDLTATGAPNPSGVLPSLLLDLFSDVVEQQEPHSWGVRESGCVTAIYPGACVQHVWPNRRSGSQPFPSAAGDAAGSSPAQLHLAACRQEPGHGTAAAAEGARCLSTASAVMPPALSVSSSGSGLRLVSPFSSASATAFDSFDRSAATDVSASAQAACNATAVARTGAPGVMETKQHGGSSAFQALTAIECIREESASEWGSSSHGGLSPSCQADPAGGFDADNGLFAAGCDVQAVSPCSPLRHSGSTSTADASAAEGEEVSSPASNGIGSSLLARLRHSKDSPAASGGQQVNGGRHGQSAESKLAHEASSELPSALIEPPAAAAAADGMAAGGAKGACSSFSYSGLAAAMPLTAADTPAAVGSARGAGLQCSSNGAAATGPACGRRTAGVVRAGNAAADAGGSARGSKRVRFAVERAAGATASRDRSLIYTAPEVLQGQRPTAKVDVFAFGVMLYEVLSRSLLVVTSDTGDTSHHAGGSLSSSPWDQGPQALLAFAQRMASGYRPPMLRHWPPAVVDLVTSCWAAEPSDRPTMECVAAQLASMAGDRQLVRDLDNFLLALSDLEGRAACQCSCTIC